jgi:hypothetical protein
MKLAKGLRDLSAILRQHKPVSNPEFGQWVGVNTLNNGQEDYSAGRIKSWNEKDIFVVFKCDGNWNRFSDYPAERLPRFVLHTLAKEQISAWRRSK